MFTALASAASHVVPHFVKIIPFAPNRLMTEVVPPPTSGIDVSNAVTTVFDLAAQCFSFITSNPLLMIFLVVGLIPAVFAIISQAKNSIS